MLFNRPIPTKIVFDQIRKAAPKEFFVIADGPRKHAPNDPFLCQETRDLVTKSIDWDCRLRTNFSEENLGCSLRVSTGLSWVFEQVDEAVILEDDCVPHQSFFSYASQLLSHYRDTKQIMSIAGARLSPFSENEPDAPYSLSAFFHSWGWATWKDRWQFYDHDLSRWRERFPPARIQALFEASPHLQHYWTECFDATRDGKIDSWSFRFMLSCWENEGFTIVPRSNLIQNIGFGEDATHTSKHLPNPCASSESIILDSLPSGEIPRNFVYEQKLGLTMQLPSLPRRVARRLKSWLKTPLQLAK